MYELERPPHLVYAGPDEAQSDRIRELHRYWLSKCRDGILPARSAIDPTDIRPLLPYLILSEVQLDPLAIHYRLVGTAVAKSHKDDFTGRDHGTVASLALSGIEAAYRQAAETGSPVFGRTGLEVGDQTWIGFEYAILPLSEDGQTVQKCLAIECTGDPAPPSSGDSAGAG